MKEFSVLAIVALTCTGCIRENPLIPTTSIPARYPDVELRALSDSEKTLVRQGIATTLPNPAFAQFRWAKFPKSPAEVEYYCGQLHTQTQSGSWVGFRPYIASVETRDGQVRQARLIEISKDRIDVGDVIAKCREHGLDPFAAVESEHVMSGDAVRR